MNLNLGQYWKQIAVGCLIALLFAMDLLHVQDEQLRYLVFTLIGSIAGWHVLNNLPGKPVAPSQPAHQ